jgi:hypothetical protein
MHNHLADDGTPVFASEMILSRTNHSQNPYRGLGFKIWHVTNNASDGNHQHEHEFDCCRTKQQDILPNLPAHTMYCSRIFCMYHVWLLSNIAAKIKPTWLIVNLVVSLKCSWLTVFKTQNWVNVAVRLKANASFCYCDDVSAIYTLVVVRTTPQSAIVVGSTHCKHKQSSADESERTSHHTFWLQRCCTKPQVWLHESVLTWLILKSTLPLDSSDAVASEVTTQTVYRVLKAWLRQIVFHVQQQRTIIWGFQK